MSVIEVRDITKQFGNTTALKNVSLSLEENRIYGLLGRNGAGKTTLLNLMTNKLFPTAGTILVDGEPVHENDRALAKIYCMPEKNLYPDSMRVLQAFHWSCEFYPGFDMKYALSLADKFQLKTSKKMKELSTGYASICKIVIAMASNAPILLLDEPVLGLDAGHRDLFYRELIARYSEHPQTIVISTHLIEEAADIIESVIILRAGEVIMQDTTQNVLSKGYTVSGPAGLVDDYIQGRNLLGFDALGGLKSAYVNEPLDASSLPAGLEASRMNLQKLFIQLTQM